MEEAAQLQHSVTVQETEESKAKDMNQSIAPKPKNYKQWLRIVLYTVFVLAGQAGGTMLGRLYFEKGGKSQWLATLMQLSGFPILIFYYCFLPLKNSSSTISSTNERPPSAMALASVYVSLGLLVAGYSFLYSIGLRYLPVSTYSLLCSSQLAFNAFFSYFLNSQKFSPFIVNSLVLLIISSILLVSQETSSTSHGVSKGQRAIGFICAISASALNGLDLSLAQLSFRMVIKRNTVVAVMDMIIYQSLVAASVVVVGLFASADWKGLKTEMEEYELGKVSYVMTLVWISMFWQGFAIGGTSLIFEVSSLFSNSVGVMGLPIVPILAFFVFGDKMDCLKVVAMVLAIWGFLSYTYQHYLDDHHSRNSEQENINVNEALEVSSGRRDGL